MPKYFLYHMRKTVVRFVIMALMLCLFVNSTVYSKYSYYGGEHTSVSLTVFSVFGVVAPFVVAALEFSQFMNRRNLDTWFSLPISRTNLFLVHFINGAVQLSAAFIVGVLVAAVKFAAAGISLGRLMTYTPIGICLMLFSYMLLTFLFLSANNLFDGCVFMAGAVLIPYNLYSIFKSFYMLFNPQNGNQIFFTGNIPGLPFNGCGIFNLIVVASERYTDLLKKDLGELSVDSALWTSARATVTKFSMPQLLLWIMICVGALAGAIFIFNKKKTENVSGVSDSWFGYRVLIPICTAGSLTSSFLTRAVIGEELLATIVSVIAIIPTIIGAFIAYVIYRRGIKFKLPDYLTLAGLVVYYIVCAIIFSSVAPVTPYMF